MKSIKKLFMLCMALIMTAAMGMTAFAASTGLITIKEAEPGKEYKIYRIFDLVLSADEKSHIYTVNEDWADFFADGAEGLKYVAIDPDSHHVTWEKGADAKELAKAAIKYAEDKKLTPVRTATCVAGTSEVKFDSLDLGYYLVESTLGVACALDTTNPSAVITEKNTLPTIDKEVEEDSLASGDNKWGDSNNADIGQEVDFKITVEADRKATNYVIHDKMGVGLEFNVNKGVTVTWTHKDASGKYVTDTLGTADYTLVTSESDLDDDCTFEVRFKDDFLKKLAKNDKIEVTYSATVTEEAATEGIINESQLTYDDDNHKEDETITYTYGLNIYKYTTNSTHADDIALAGAKFILYRKNGAKTEYAKFDTDFKFAEWVEDRNTATVLVSGDDGFIKVFGLDADTYYIEETEAPEGYNKLEDPTTVIIEKDGKVSPAESVGNVDAVKVENRQGEELPSTGGIGTKIFYIVGTVLMAGAAILLITKKRMSSDR